MHGVKCAKKPWSSPWVLYGSSKLGHRPVTPSCRVGLFVFKSDCPEQKKKARQRHLLSFRRCMGGKIFLLCFFALYSPYVPGASEVGVGLLCENWASLGGGPIFVSVPSFPPPSLFLEPQWPHFLPIIVFFNTPPVPVRGPPLIKRPFPAAAQPQRQEARGVFPCIIYERKKAPGRPSEANSKQFFSACLFFLAPQLSVGA